MSEKVLELGRSKASSVFDQRIKGLDSKKIEFPKTDDELWFLIYNLLGIKIPRTKVCPDHCAPFTAVADAFFARSPIAIWHASRGFGGKSFNLAALSLIEAIVGMKCNLLGGSGEQAARVLNYMYGDEVPDVMWDAPGAPRHLIKGGFEKGALKRETKLIHGGYIRALMASAASIRGPHPERLRLDEVDEMDITLFDASMGQTMALRNFQAQTVASSTWHNADGTMTELMERAEDRDWPIYSWCYLENLVSNGGWLPDSEVERKQREVSTTMFRIEYDLQEPNPEDRAFDPSAVSAMFNKELGIFVDDSIEIQLEETPEAGAIYLHGVDWGKRTHYTCIWTMKVLDEGDPGKPKANPPIPPTPPRFRIVQYKRLRRKPWPVLVGMVEKRIKYYASHDVKENYACHDETGVGDVIADYIENVEITGVWMTGRTRYEMLTDYQAAVEHGYIEGPYIKRAYKEHSLCSNDDMFGSGSTNHLPDTVAAGALAYYIWRNRPKRRRIRATWGK